LPCRRRLQRFYRWSAAANFPQGYNNSIIIAEVSLSHNTRLLLHRR
jgi:hypothetical protein